MAINYTNLFEDIGKFIKSGNKFRNTATSVGSPSPDIDALQGEVETTLTGNGSYASLSGISELFNGLKDRMVSACQEMGSRIQTRLMDYDTVVSQLPLPANPSIQQVLSELIIDMVANAQDVLKSTAAFGSTTYNSGNVGNGVLQRSLVLDGYSQPHIGTPSNPKYLGVNSELVLNDTIHFECVRDSYDGQLTAGEEQFSWKSDQPFTSPFNWRGEGGGDGPVFTVLNAATLVTNRDFETFTTTDIPDGWTVSTGTVGTHINQSTAQKYRGSSSLELTGDGSLAAIKLTFPLNRASLNPLRRYCLAMAIQSNLVGGNAGTFTARLEGTGYTSTEAISIAPGSYSATWAYSACFINLPANVPSDLKLIIQLAGTPTNAKSVWIDSLAFGPAVWHQGISVAILAGSTPWAKGDRIDLVTSNDDAGVIQTFFRKQFHVQLPSSATPSLADSLAT